MANKCYVCKSKRYLVKVDSVWLCKKCRDAIHEWLKKPRNLDDGVKEVAKRIKHRFDYRRKKHKPKQFVPAKAKKAKTVTPVIEDCWLQEHPKLAEDLNMVDDLMITGVSNISYEFNSAFQIPKEQVRFED